MATTEPQILDVEGIREDFPILQREFGGEQLVYLDNAATAQTPNQVIDAMSDYYRETNANVHRGLHHLSQEASIAYEDAHDRLAEFVGASGGREEMIFTKNTTDGENLVAYSWGLNELGPGDEVVTTEMEHHSSLVTWQQIAKRTGAEITYIRVDDDGELDMDHAKELITDDTGMVSVVHVSNTLGTKTRSARSPRSPTTTTPTSSSTAPSRCRRCRSTSRRSAPTSTPFRGTKWPGRRASVGCTAARSCWRRWRRSTTAAA